MKRLVLYTLVAMVVIGFVISGGFAQDIDQIPTRVPFTISKNTTYIIEPQTPRGLVNYAAALNNRMSRDVKPSTNAATFFHHALGPRPAGTSLNDRFYEELGIERPPEDGEYFITYRDYLSATAGMDPHNRNTSRSLNHLQLAIDRPWTSEDYPHVAGWLEANQRPLTVIGRGCEQPDYYRPIVPAAGREGAPLTMALEPVAQASRHVAEALLTRAMRKAGQGKAHDAWDDVLVTYHFGDRVGRGPTMIEGLSGITIESLAIQAAPMLIEHVQPDAELARRWLHDIEELPIPPQMARKVGLYKRCEFLDMVQRFAVANVISGSFESEIPLQHVIENIRRQDVDWDTAMEMANRWFDRAAKAMAIEDPRQRYAKLVELERIVEAPDKFSSVFKPRDSPDSGAGEVIGHLMQGTTIPLQGPQAAEDRTKQRLQNTRVALALAAYEDEKGNYPQKLGALVPRYLKEIPADTFTGEPLHYQATDTGYLLYGVGENRKDDTGRSYQDEPSGDDLRIRMPSEPTREK